MDLEMEGHEDDNKVPIRQETRMSLEERIQCIRLYSIYEQPSRIQIVWKQKFGTEPPSRKTIASLNKKFDRTGSVADLVRTGRPKSSTGQINATLVESAVKRNPTKTLRALSDDLGINKTAVYRIKRESEITRNLIQTANKKLKEKIQFLNKQIESLESRVTSLAKAAAANRTSIPKPTLPDPEPDNSVILETNTQLQPQPSDNEAEQLHNNVEFLGQNILVTGPNQTAIFDIIPSATGNANTRTQILHLPPELFRLIQVPVPVSNRLEIDADGSSNSTTFVPCGHQIFQSDCLNCLSSILQFQPS